MSDTSKMEGGEDMTNTSKLKAAILENGLRIIDVASAIGLSEQGFRKGCTTQANSKPMKFWLYLEFSTCDAKMSIKSF